MNLRLAFGHRLVSALSHIRVIDLSRVLAGPWASQVLGDLGADVIKIERPGGGDDTRSWGPPYLRDSARQLTSESAYFLSANRNKRSVTVDFTQPEGQSLVQKLAAGADALIENFKVGGLAKYKLDYESLKAVNSRLIYCSITGFGQTGPYASRPGYDVLLQAMGGFMSITGTQEGMPGAGPQKVGVPIVDLLTGLYSAVGILAALSVRDRTGVGQYIDMALLDVEVACLANQGMNYLVSGHSPKRAGNAHPNIVPYQDFPTQDAAMVVAVGNDGQFRRFSIALGCPELGTDPRYAMNSARVANRDVLLELIRARTVTRTTREWVAIFEAVNVPCGPINTVSDVFEDPQVVARGLRTNIDHPLSGIAPTISSPLRLSEAAVEYRYAPPLLGQHTTEILREVLGLSQAEIRDLVARGVVSTQGQ
jgi:crotonobetainyl-CoA:carnitine CoA-transferase CaiB-like acyl-CoA transferase